MNQVRISPVGGFHGLTSVLGVFFSALTLLVGCQEGCPVHKGPVLPVSKGSVPEQLGGRKTDGEAADPGSTGKYQTCIIIPD